MGEGERRPGLEPELELETGAGGFVAADLSISEREAR